MVAQGRMGLGRSASVPRADWMAHREFWRMYESSQFLHYRSVQEDWRERDTWFGQEPTRRGERVAGPVLGVINNLWLFVEVFEFLSRLHRAKRSLRDRRECLGSTAPRPPWHRTDTLD